MTFNHSNTNAAPLVWSSTYSICADTFAIKLWCCYDIVTYKFIVFITSHNGPLSQWSAVFPEFVEGNCWIGRNLGVIEKMGNKSEWL